MKTKNYTLQKSPFIVPTIDNKIIKEHFGNISTSQSNISIAYMIAPPNWEEPFQKPEFDEYTIVLKGKKRIIIEDEMLTLSAGQSIKIEKNRRVKYSNPFDETCEYIAICIPAFSLDLVKRENE